MAMISTISNVLNIYRQSENITYDELCQKCYEANEGATIANIINIIHNSTNFHVKDNNDYMNILKDLNEAYDKYINATHIPYISEDDIPQVLYWFDSEKYAYRDEYDKFWNLPVITDTDFISYKSMTDEEYHIVYDIMYNDAGGVCVYDVVATYYNEYKTPIGRKVALKHWIECFKKIIDSLNQHIETEPQRDVCVYIPFLGEYKELGSHVVDLLKMAIDTASLLRESDGSTVELEKPEKVERIQSMFKVFEEWRDYEAQEDIENAGVIHDEMIRRGLCPNQKLSTYKNYYKDFIIKSKELSDGKQNNSVKEQEKEDFKEKSVKDRTAVLYYMLKDKIDTVLMHKIAHYMCNPNKEYRGANPNDTTYTYLSKPDANFLDKQDRIDYIKNELTKYKFDEEYINKIK